MSVRDGVIEVLANGGAGCVSGEELASQLGVSRAAVWKAVQKLQEEGFPIEGTPSKGYVLEGTHDVLTEAGVMANLRTEELRDGRVRVKRKTGTTMDDARELADAGAPEFSAVVAGEQTAGRGRRGRPFFSPRDSGVYFSILLRPQFPIDEAFLITGASAVAVCRAIRALTGKEAVIKWVNDVYIGDMKVCGIATEAAADLETGGLSYTIPGIGINVYEPEGGFPEEIAARAGAVMDGVVPGMRNRFAAAVMDELHDIYCKHPFESFVGEYQSLSMMPGRDIMVVDSRGGEAPARAIRVNDDLSLRVRYADGMEADLQTGEVSIRL